MDLKCFEETNGIWFNNRVKSLFKITRDILFYTEFCCEYCSMKDFDHEWMKIHIKYEHDEFGIPTTQFLCKICLETVSNEEILRHIMCEHIK